MAQNYSPKIAQDGLVMCLDATQNKSYPTTDVPVKNGLLLWLDAADDTTFSYSSGTEVSQWRDKSGNDFHANQSTTAVQPTRNTTNNSRKSVNFVSATGDNLIISSGISLPNDASIFILYKPATQSYQYAVLIDNYHGQGGNYGFVIQRVSTNTQFYYANGNGSGFIDTSASPWNYTDNVIQLLSLNKSGTTGTPYTSGTAQTSRTVYANTAQYTTGLAIGTWGYGGGRFYNGDICEILIFNRALTTTEMKQVHTYLGQKWGIFNSDRSVFDLSGNGFDFLFNGANPRYNAKAFISNFNTTSPYAISAFGGQNLTSTILNLLYTNHTIEVAVNPKGFQSVYNYNNALTTQTAQGIVLWTGQHSGLYFAGTDLYYVYWNSASSTVGISCNVASYQDKIMYITATRSGDILSLYINGILVSGPSSVAATTAPLTYTQMNIGCAYVGNPTTQGYVWAGQHEYYLVRMYQRALNQSEVSSNYQSFKSRFDNNVVRYGLILDLDASNPYSYAGAGTTWYDTSGNSYNSTLTNGPTYSTTNSGIINFDGVDDYSVATVASITNSSTIGIWIKSSSYNNKIPVSIASTNYGSGPNIFFYNNYINWNTGDGAGNPFSNSSYPNSSWHYIVVTNDSTSNAKLYIDGVLIGTAGYRSTLSSTSNNFWLGRFSGDNNYTINASIGASHLYNRILSAAEVLQNYNATKGRFGL